MVIQTSNVALGNQYSFFKTNLESVSYTSWGDVVSKTGNTAATTPSATDSEQTTGKEVQDTAQSSTETGLQTAMEQLLAKTGQSQAAWQSEADDAIYEGSTKVEYNSMKHMMMLLNGQNELQSRKVTPWTLFQQLMLGYQERMEKILNGLGLAENAVTSSVTPTESFGGNVSVQHFYEEKESSSFYSSGSVVTEDGRTIEFDLEAQMSRSFSQYSSVELDFGAARLMDPLVISLDGNAPAVSDQKFLFDIDCDGVEDNISLLAKGCGFLALDKNEDGVINDGNELFGSKSGDGFGDLAVFDMDGNGWIDENDEVFNHLRIWTKDESGEDKLVGLGVAGVGAIYLGNTATQFHMNSMVDNSTNAVVRNSGVFLHENGTAGMISQVDFAVQ